MVSVFKDKKDRDNMRQAMLNYIGDKEIFAYDPYSENYLISNLGRVFSQATNRFLKPTKNDTGYFYVKLYFNNKKKTVHLHRLVARTFLNMTNYEVNHINAIKSDNRLINLELVTREENLQHARDNKLFKSRKGLDSPSFIFTNEIIDDMICLKKQKKKLKEIASKYNTSQSYVCTLIKMREKGLR